MWRNGGIKEVHSCGVILSREISVGADTLNII